MTESLGHLKVMLVDDEEFVRAIMRRILHALGINLIEEAADGVAALSQLEKSCPDAMFLDLMMEPMGGIELLRRMRQHTIDAIRTLPVIVLTLNSDSEMVNQLVPLGIQDYLIKPVTPDVVRQKLVQVTVLKGSAG